MLNCVAFAQRRPLRTYARELGWNLPSEPPSPRTRRDASYDIRPGQEARLLSLSSEKEERIARAGWGYATPTAAGMSPALSARIAKAANGRYPTLWRYGRAVLPVDCWYAAPEPGSSAQRCVRRAIPGAMFIAAITNFWLAGEGTASAGFLVVSGESGEGVAGPRDREPLVLAAEDARLWLDPGLSVEQVQRLVMSVALSPDCFEVHAEAVMEAAADRGAKPASRLGTPFKPGSV